MCMTVTFTNRDCETEYCHYECVFEALGETLATMLSCYFSELAEQPTAAIGLRCI